MRRRDFCKLIVAGASASLAGAVSLGEDAQQTSPLTALSTATAGRANYPNHRAPLLPLKYTRLPLGSIRPAGWLSDQLTVQVHGLTSHIGELWDILTLSAWKGDAGKNVLPECCTPRFAPRWLEGLTVLSGVLGNDHLKALTDPYMQYILDVHELAAVTPSVIAWSHLGRFLPDYYELTGDRRAITLLRKILDYSDASRDSQEKIVLEDPGRLGMLLSFGYWYYDQTGDADIPAMLERCSRPSVDDWKDYFAHFPQDPKYFVHFPDVTAEKPGLPPPDWTRQGVDVTQAIQYPVQHYVMSGDKSDVDSVIQGIANLDQGYGQVGGRWSGDEWLANTDPAQGTELCDVEELLFSLEKSFEIVGELSFADRIEQLIYNAFPGTCTPDMWAHQYDQQSNQVLVSVAERHWHWNTDTSNIYGFTPNFPCCLANMHSPWPRFVQTMWMATEDRGLVAATYGPCRVHAKVAAGLPIEIVEETNYPFSDRVRITIHTGKPTSFPIYFRIPSWAVGAEVAIAGESLRQRPQQPASSGTFFKVDRLWKSGDSVTLNFNFKVRCEKRRNNAVAVAWGPLYFVLHIAESFKNLPSIPLGPKATETPAPPGCANWQITPATSWNYALVIDRQNPQCAMTSRRVSSMPFAQRGEMVKQPGATQYAPWNGDVPLALHVKARKVPGWGMNGASAAQVPLSPVRSDSPEETVELIPYGCSRLRIAEFPTT